MVCLATLLLFHFRWFDETHAVFIHVAQLFSDFVALLLAQPQVEVLVQLGPSWAQHFGLL